MTDKEKIREEVEKRFEQIKNSEKESDSGAFYQLKELLSFIDSLQEEPVSKDLEKVAKQYEEDAIFYATRNISNFFKDGANWQKEQFMKDAVETEYGWIKPIIYSSTEKTFNIGNDDKVKLIIIKED